MLYVYAITRHKDASSLPVGAISDESYGISTPVNSGFLPASSLISNMSAGTPLNRLLGSLRKIRVVSPVLVIVVVNIRSSTLSTVFGPETCKERLGPRKVAAAERTGPIMVMQMIMVSIT